MVTRAAFLFAGVGSAIGVASMPIDAEAVSGVTRSIALRSALERPETLAYRAAKSGILFGSFVASEWLEDAGFAQAVSQECSLIYPARMSTDATRKYKSGFYYGSADKVVDFATSHGLALAGGYLVVHGYQPPWITPDTDRATALAEMRLEISTTMNRYAGRLDHWIVVNEAVDASSKNPYGLRECTWLSTIGGDVNAGTDYVSEAFKQARSVDPHATLVLNENHLEGDSEYEERKRHAVLELLRALRRNGTPIDALGMQAHLQGQEHFSSQVLNSFLTEVTDMGIKIIVSELDVIDVDLPADVEARDASVAKSISDFLNVVLRYNVKTVNVWGIGDNYSWYNSPKTPTALRRGDGIPSRGTILDSALHKKPAYTAIADAFDRIRG